MAPKAAPGDPARPRLTALQPPGMNSGSRQARTPPGAMQSGSAPQSEPAFIHRAQNREESSLLRVGKSQPTLGTCPSPCERPRASAALARALSD